jgi:peptidoglycan LD-endopeptidase CwlK
MPKFSVQSKLKLQKLHPDLQRICIRLIEKYDFVVIETHRSQERQQQLLKEGKTKTLNSKHLFFPSKAVDIAPYPID